MPSNNDLDLINNLTSQFFDVFTNSNNRTPNVSALKEMFIPEGIIISNTNGNTIVYSIGSFIAPRIEMLTNGTLLNFSEYEVSHKTEIYNTIAHRFCNYEKSGELNGKYFKSKGIKTLQFIKVANHWKLSSVAWCDES
ncbi:DUF4440 domain-containing protein [Jejuia spongiicola]|uniref:DUF4440 domain-containing protein n=1 Tax=Jejuia spongiicola TaxID=2942207 RepID=A0ABT0QHZ6_9FLAO|nr:MULTISPECIES: DUF4440 domain-containing protein [Flavobacteriaceae]MCL6296495.1 hypothetical protein [Jejuia spongiicola]PIA82243.1 hypothetical protein BFR04_10775 [Gaetbulibacter sp. 4G1]